MEILGLFIVLIVVIALAAYFLRRRMALPVPETWSPPSPTHSPKEDTAARKSPRAVLHVVDANRTSLVDKRIKLFEDEITFGRDPARVHLQLDDLSNMRSTVSRVHCLIRYDASSQSFVLVDLESKNGTFVNGEEVPANVPIPLTSGTDIEIGMLGMGGAMMMFYTADPGANDELSGEETIGSIEALKDFAQNSPSNLPKTASLKVRGQKERPRVFISYKRSTSGMLAQLIAEKLRGYGIGAYLDTLNIDGAGPFPEILLKAIEDNDVFICLLAKGTLESDWVMHEIEHSHRLGKPMIPVFQESYTPIKAEDSPGAHVDTLLKYDGIHILDERNLFVNEAIDKLAAMVRITCANLRKNTPVE